MKDLNAIQSFLKRTVSALEQARDAGDAQAADTYSQFLDRANKAAEIGLQEHSQQTQQAPPGRQEGQGLQVPFLQANQELMQGRKGKMDQISPNTQVQKAFTGTTQTQEPPSAGDPKVIDRLIEGLIPNPAQEQLPNPYPKLDPAAPALDPAGNFPSDFQDEELTRMLQNQRGMDDTLGQFGMPENPTDGDTLPMNKALGLSMQDPNSQRDLSVDSIMEKKYTKPEGLFSLENLVWLLLFGAQGAQRKMSGEKNKYQDARSREYDLYDRKKETDRSRADSQDYKNQMLEIQKLLANKKPDRMGEIEQRHKNALELADVKGAYSGLNTRMATTGNMLREAGLTPEEVMRILNTLSAGKNPGGK